MATTEIAQHIPAIRRLAARWLTAVAGDPAVRAADGDFVCSPVGLWLTLSVVAAGARAETARELRALLGTAGPEAAVSTTEAARAMRETDGLTVATGAWARTPVYRAFRESLPDIRFGQLAPDDPSAVDVWVRQATQGLIMQLPEPPAPETQLLLVNALALKAEWEIPFLWQNTAERPFTDAHGTEHRVPTMFQKLSRPSHAWTAPGPSGGTVDVVALRCEAREGRTPAQVSLVLSGSPAGPPRRFCPPRGRRTSSVAPWTPTRSPWRFRG